MWLYDALQDGSCNGLQHYAALGRDQAGAEQVNVAPADVPQDVYSGTAKLVVTHSVNCVSSRCWIIYCCI